MAHLLRAQRGPYDAGGAPDLPGLTSFWLPSPVDPVVPGSRAASGRDDSKGFQFSP